jgi:hypothetical protein
LTVQHDRLVLAAFSDIIGQRLQLVLAEHREDHVDGVELDYLLLEGGRGGLGAGLLAVIPRVGAFGSGKGLKSNAYSS